MGINRTINRVEPAKEYNLSNIRDEALFPWAKDIRTIRKIVKRDGTDKNILKCATTGTGRALDYKIKGKNIILFLELYGPGFMMSAKNSTHRAETKL